MVTVCAWCERFLGASGSEAVVTHGICEPCAARQRWPDSPVVVVAPHRADVCAVLEQVLRGEPRIRIVIDRRAGDRRRRRDAPESLWERRFDPDRRRRPADAVIT